ncbi:hypothetical protein TVAG_244700 [Trichomonas vaginalis G3]|uniref:Uncharacterized protein n=1 Tax=Trichomonas vaginalis (strain ATCC PRA-98 / G3) TaxID=412133 RepID=A2H2Z0_TRIV3|nr:hypothetical protein TVAGG3_0855820 [Trichomonas vaginalis G3]EAX76226.1 hypothetical protein TVAG_244700 [Trichomonas vaginalis G3]KAI5500338.1 hypothetical protein TVAGG3_0855820 [Trichomonas vaginalis G3]|eukprot:XP_001289156.1 hypothetical protein [Trichomonas vaginalis G3]
MAQVALSGKLSCPSPSGIPSPSFWHSESFLLAFRVLPSGIPSPSFRQKKFFLLAFRVLPSDRKSFSFRQEKFFLLSVRKPFKFSKIENFLADLQKKFFLPTGKVFLSDRKSFSFRQEKFFFPTFRVLPSDRTQTNVRRTTNRVHSKARRTDSPSTTTD